MKHFKFELALFLFLLALLLSSKSYGISFSSENTEDASNELSLSGGMSIYQSGYAMQLCQQAELAYSRSLTRFTFATVGVRYHSNSDSPSGFLRYSLSNCLGAWRPSAGIEMGIEDPTFSSSANLLKETREAMCCDMGYVYLSSHIAPLCFSIGNRWSVSAFEINFGSHIKNMGRTLFVQVDFINLNYSF